MKLFLTSHYLEEKHFKAFRKLLGGKKAQKALFITTASVPYGHNPKPDWLIESLNDMSKLTEKYDEATLEDGALRPDNLEQYDFVFVAGGNVFYLAYRLAETGMDEKIKEYIKNGGIYSGSSAGSIILMESIANFTPADDPEKAPEIYPGLGIIEEAIIPHVDSEKYGEIMEGIAEEYRKEGKNILMLNDSQVFVVDGDKKEVL